MTHFGNHRGRGGFRGRGREGGKGGRGGPKLPAALRDQLSETFGQSGKSKKKRALGDSDSKAQMRPQRESYDDDEDETPRAGSSKQSAAIAKKGRSSAEAVPPPRKKKRELRLPTARIDDAEDGEIEWLEYALRKEKGKGKEEDSDGLDDLLSFADIIGPGGQGLSRGQDGMEDDDDDDDDDDDGLNGLLDGFESGETAEEDGEDETEITDMDNDGEDSVGDGEEVDLAESSGDDEEVTASRSRDDQQNESAAATALSTTKYVPPHMRAAQLAEKAQGSKEKALNRQKLERKTQGLLNKLSEANIESIITGIEELYRNNSRNDVTTTITDLVLQMISNKSNLLDSFVSLYATFVGALHRIVGVEFGAHFLHTLIMRYKNPTQASAPAATIYETPDSSKESLNLLTLVAELYNSGVVGPRLIYDLIRELIAAGLREEDVEALLKLVKRCGSQLRSEDPGSLKDITNLVQEKTNGQDMTVRTRFMLETLTSLKAAKKESNRFLASLGKKRRHTRGKWWLVGAGWQGNPLLEAKPVEKSEDSLLEMAREQGMNTDVRRSIFVILMTSEDFVHACDRMAGLKYTETQQREFVRVTLHCCNLEKSYNPYYTLVLNHLCSESYSHRFTLQYALWDLLRGNAGDNVAKAVAYIIARGSLDLTVFKAIDFTSLKKPLVAFFRTLLVFTILATQTTSPLFALSKQPFDKDVIQETFEKPLANLELAQGLSYVISRYGSKLGDGLDEKRAAMVKKGLEIARRVLSRAV